MKKAKAEKMLNGAYIVARGGLPVSPRIYSHRDTASGVASVLNGDETILNTYAELTLSAIDTETLTTLARYDGRESIPKALNRCKVASITAWGSWELRVYVY